MNRPAREAIWAEAWIAVAGSDNCINVDAPARWADSCLAAFEERFPTPVAIPVVVSQEQIAPATPPSPPAAAGFEGTIHPDDLAVDLFAAAMKAKLEFARNKRGYGGWDNKAKCTAGHLSDLLRDHVAKGDPTDVANFACFLWNRGEGITPRQFTENPDAAKELPFFKDETALISFLDSLYEMDSAGAVEGDKWEPAQRAIAGIRGQQEAKPRAPDGHHYRYLDALGTGSFIRKNNGEEVNGAKPAEAIPYWYTPQPYTGLSQFKDLADKWLRLANIDALQVSPVQPHFLVERVRGCANSLLALIAEEEARNG